MLLKFYLMLVLVFRLGDKPTKNGDLAVFYLYYFIAREITTYSIVTALLLIFVAYVFTITLQNRIERADMHLSNAL